MCANIFVWFLHKHFYHVMLHITGYSKFWHHLVKLHSITVLNVSEMFSFLICFASCDHEERCWRQWCIYTKPLSSSLALFICKRWKCLFLRNSCCCKLFRKFMTKISVYNITNLQQLFGSDFLLVFLDIQFKFWKEQASLKW